MRRLGLNPLSDFLNAVVRRVYTGTTVLDFGAINDGEFVKRSGSALVGSPAGSKLVFEFGDANDLASLGANQASRFPDLPASTITKVRIEGDAAGSAVVDIQTSTADPPSYSSICGLTKPTLLSDAFAEDSTLIGWTTTITDGTKMRAVLESVSGMKQVTVVLTLLKS
jgi:hypothetical protein